MLDRVQLKLEAKAITKNARVSAYLFTLLYLVIVMVLQGLDALVSGGTNYTNNGITEFETFAFFIWFKLDPYVTILTTTT